MKVSKVFDKYFNGAKNVFTPNTFAFGKRRFGDEMLLIEISQGEGLFDTPLYGIVFLVWNTKTGEVQRIDLDKPVKSRQEITEYIESINLEMIQKADRYGEIKFIVELI